MAQKISILCLCFFILCSFSNMVYAKDQAASSTNLPIILNTAKIIEGEKAYMSVRGLVEPGHEVLIYLNGIYNGLANISQATANFSLFSYLSAIAVNVEKNEVMVIARDDETSALTPPVIAPINTIIEKSYIKPVGLQETIKATNNLISAPILKTPSQKNCESTPYISGFSKNQTTVSIYIDNRLYTSLHANSNIAETAFFSYVPVANFTRGQHTVYATAENKNGHVSPKSNTLSFCISDPQIISTSTANTIESVDSIIATNTINKSDLVFQKTNNQEVANKNIREKTSHKINLLLFGVFILVVVIWIIFVNKELAEENAKNIKN